MSLPCFSSFLRLRGCHLTKADLTVNVFSLADILVLRRYAPNLEVLQGKFVVVSEHSQQVKTTFFAFK